MPKQSKGVKKKSRMLQFVFYLLDYIITFNNFSLQAHALFNLLRLTFHRLGS